MAKKTYISFTGSNRQRANVFWSKGGEGISMPWALSGLGIARVVNMALYVFRSMNHHETETNWIYPCEPLLVYLLKAVTHFFCSICNFHNLIFV